MAKSRKATLHMQKKGGRLQWCGKYQEAAYDALVQGFPEGQLVQVVVSKQTHPKTSAQLGYYYGVLLPFASQAFRDMGYDEYPAGEVMGFEIGFANTPDTTDEILKRLYATHKGLAKPPLKRDMSDEEMSEFIDWVVRFLATNLGAVAPEAEKN
jgi:hypothetical protein